MASTATKDILDYMKTHPHGITQKEASDMFGTIRLSAIIYQLRHSHGYAIETMRDECVTRYGKKALYARYVLREDVLE